MHETIETCWYRMPIDTIGMDYESAVDAMPHWVRRIFRQWQ